MKLAESLSPITKKLDEVEETTQKLGDNIKESQPEAPQLAIENTPNRQPIENNESALYDVDLENTLKNMENNNTGSFISYHDPQRGWIMNNYPIKMLCGTEVEIKDKEYNITPVFQKVFTDTS